MSYCTGKNIEIARGKAMKMLIIEKIPAGVVADRFGVHRSTIWNIPSFSAAPKSPHTLSNDLIQLVLDIRDQLKRCAEVVWHYINSVLCINISLSSVRRILKRNGKMKKPKNHKN